MRVGHGDEHAAFQYGLAGCLKGFVDQVFDHDMNVNEDVCYLIYM